MKSLLASLSNLLVVTYPFLVFLGLGHFEPRYLALLLLLIVILRLCTGNSLKIMAQAEIRKLVLAFTLAGLSLVTFSFMHNTAIALRLYPVLVNLAFLGIFAYSLYSPPSIVERIARITEPDLPASGVTYTRKVTLLWCFFFIFNGTIAALTSFFASLEIWALYNGFMAYILMACLFAGEFTYRTLIVRKRET